MELDITMGSNTLNHSPDDLGKVFQEFLTKLCDTAVDCLTAEKAPLARIHADIKGLTTFQGSPDVRYQVLARSKYPDRQRVAHEENKIEPYRLSDNAIFQKIVFNQGKKDFCRIPDIEQFIADWVDGDDFYPEPHPATAPRFYKSTLVVAIRGSLGLSEMGWTRAAAPFGEDKALLGFISVDSKESNMFNEEWDLDILRQLAGEAFNALRLYYKVEAAVRTSPVRLVP